MKQINIGLIGLGTVGTGVVKILKKNAGLIKQRTGCRVVISKIAEKLGRKDLVRLGAIPANPSEPDVLVGDIGRLSEEVGWRPRYSIDQGLTKTIRWWKSRSKDTQ